MIIDKINSDSCIFYCAKKNINCKKQCTLSNKTDVQIVKKACKLECILDKKKNTIKKKKNCIIACNKISLIENKNPRISDEPETPKSPNVDIKLPLYIKEKNILQTSFNSDTKIIPILSRKDEKINIIDKQTNNQIELEVDKKFAQYHECQEPGKVIYIDQNTNVDLEPKYIIKTLVNPNPGEEMYMCSLYKDEHKYDTEKGENHTNRTGHGIHTKKNNIKTEFEVLCVNGKNPHNDCSEI